MVRRLILDQVTVGSNPTRAAKEKNSPLDCSFLCLICEIRTLVRILLPQNLTHEVRGQQGSDRRSGSYPGSQRKEQSIGLFFSLFISRGFEESYSHAFCMTITSVILRRTK